MTIMTKPGTGARIPRQFTEVPIAAESADGTGPAPIIAVVDGSEDELTLVGVTMTDLEILADATRRCEARRLDYEDRIRVLREQDERLAEIMAELEAAQTEMSAYQQRVEAGLTIDDRMEGTARVEIAGLIRVTYPTPQLRFKSKVSLREAYDDPLIRGAMGIYQESTKPPTIRVEVLS